MHSFREQCVLSRVVFKLTHRTQFPSLNTADVKQGREKHEASINIHTNVPHTDVSTRPTQLNTTQQTYTRIDTDSLTQTHHLHKHG